MLDSNDEMGVHSMSLFASLNANGVNVDVVDGVVERGLDGEHSSPTIDSVESAFDKLSQSVDVELLLHCGVGCFVGVDCDEQHCVSYPHSSTTVSRR